MLRCPKSYRCRTASPTAAASSLASVGRPAVSEASATASTGICGFCFIVSMRSSPISRFSNSMASTLLVAIQSSIIASSSSWSIDMRTSSE